MNTPLSAYLRAAAPTSAPKNSSSSSLEEDQAGISQPSNSNSKAIDAQSLANGLNFYLGKMTSKYYDEDDDTDTDIDIGTMDTTRNSYRNQSSLRSIVVTEAKQVDDDFDARKSAISRTYVYRIIAPSASYYAKARAIMDNNKGNKNKDFHNSVYAPSDDSLLNHRWIFEEQRAWVLSQPVDVVAMRIAALALLGEQDFSSFRNAGCVSSTPWRRVMGLDIKSMPFQGVGYPIGSVAVERSIGGSIRSVDEVDDGEGEAEADAECIEITITASSFLLRMVRNLVGGLVQVGTGRVDANEMKKILDKKDRSALRVKPAPAEGLYLKNVAYADSV